MEKKSGEDMLSKFLTDIYPCPREQLIALAAGVFITALFMFFWPKSFLVLMAFGILCVFGAAQFSPMPKLVKEKR